MADRRPKHVKRVHNGAAEAPDGVQTEEARRLFDRIVDDLSRKRRDLFDDLSAYERDVVVRWLAEAVLTGDVDNLLHDVLWEVDFIRKPVSIEQFVNDEYYFGRMGSELHSKWKGDLSKVFAPGSKVIEWIMTGSIGSGKTTVAAIALPYCLYRLSCMRDPASYYGLLPDSQIVLGIYSITKRQVVDTGYSKMRGYIDTSPYFRFEFPRNKKIDSLMDFEPAGKRIKIISGSTELHALGLDLYGYSMDEANFMRVRQDKESGSMAGQAYDLYNAVRTRLMSRFMRPGGVIPGIMLLMSSRKAQSSFLEQHLKKVQGTEHTHVSDYKLWEVKEAGKFGTKYFRVEVGDRTSQSRILTAEDTPRTGAKVVDVPESLKAPFLEDVDQALRDVAGVATFNISPLIRDRSSVQECKRERIPNPFTRDRIQVGTEDDDYVEDFFDVNRVCRIVGGKYRPLLNPMSARFIHVDIGLTADRAGIAMGHVSGLVKGHKQRADGIMSEDVRPFIIMDFLIGMDPPLSGEIEIAKIRAFIAYLLKFYRIVSVTADGFQSRDMVQVLNRWMRSRVDKVDGKKRKFADVLSIDRTDLPYLALRNALFERRVAYYPYSLFEREMLDLERDPNTAKVNHPERASDGSRGSKDVADAAAGVVFQIVQDPRSTENAVLLPDASVVSESKVVDPVDVAEREPERVYRIIGGQKVSLDELRRNVELTRNAR